ncbi:DNA mismatch repair endonuclease MutL [Colwellia sp. Arc7-635]|uniref:DNA mismatch repair endonuclease MutL n=1 Tax=Colwellia sp. Arc7-635 TaxID=2497879 RepID=UPI000F85B340|nr:DNA mismatch repair endonuclease MutL [Colwellia sp. Arc7-635]AZQ82911.1 DNA mismatch repair endonuclease MutL [Colwellia sp. Arc7-635]
MTIAILPARLANQIAAGEVVERPASVVKELVENSIDAGATTIKIDIEKGGAKRIRISDNGKGIAKDELALALSRHATSKIKDLDDLEAISSLGFRGEALASISSVARLSLTSKPEQQESAWQACAEGRDMAVSVKPAAHPNGTTIDVCDLFFNTPARRKFLRTEKTEFAHIEEVVKRIALAHFDITFVLTHNHKVVKQFRVANSSIQRSKRVAQVCGQKFIDNAVEVDCEHDGLHLHGWIAQPSFYRNQNDLCYSYVNERMMRDKLINHAIRQAYADLLPRDSYPAFVLFLKLDFREVDVNVHPAKHEVRFHQGRYVHDFIYSVCSKALRSELALNIDSSTGEIFTPASDEQVLLQSGLQTELATKSRSDQQAADNSFVTPLRQTTEQAAEVSFGSSNSMTESNYGNREHASAGFSAQANTRHYGERPSAKVNPQASKAYSDLMTPLALDSQVAESSVVATPDHVLSTSVPITSDEQDVAIDETKILYWQAPHYLVFQQQQTLRLLSVRKIDLLLRLQTIKQRWHEKLVSQPLLLPIKVTVSEKVANFVQINTNQFQHIGMEIRQLGSTKLQIRQFPALLRNKDIANSFNRLIKQLDVENHNDVHSEIDWQMALAELMLSEEISQAQAFQIWRNAESHFNCQFEQQLRLNSVVVDLTSSINQLK